MLHFLVSFLGSRVSNVARWRENSLFSFLTYRTKNTLRADLFVGVEGAL